MSNENQIVEETMPEQEVTVTPELEEIKPDEPQTEEPVKVFTQKELDEIVGKRLAREQRKWERNKTQTSSLPETKVIPSDETLSKDQFNSPEEYAEALIKHKAAQLIAEYEYDKQKHSKNESFLEKEEEISEKYDDYYQVARSENLNVTLEMAEAIKDSDIGPEILYHLGTNPKEALRISKLNPIAQIKEITKLETKFLTQPEVKKVTKAPAPITPVVARGSNPNYDTTDPRSVKAMSASEWIEAENKREMAKLRARYQT